jgi:hypothetical protein
MLSPTTVDKAYLMVSAIFSALAARIAPGDKPRHVG